MCILYRLYRVPSIIYFLLFEVLENFISQFYLANENAFIINNLPEYILVEKNICIADFIKDLLFKEKNIKFCGVDSQQYADLFKIAIVSFLWSTIFVI